MVIWPGSEGPRQNLGTGVEHIRLGRHFALASIDKVEGTASSGASYEDTRILNMRPEGKRVPDSWRYVSL